MSNEGFIDPIAAAIRDSIFLSTPQEQHVRAVESAKVIETNAILAEQFKVACERAEAWKAMALGVKDAFGKVTSLLGEASAYLGVVGTEDAIKLDKEIMETMKNINVPIPAILREEVESEVPRR